MQNEPPSYVVPLPAKALAGKDMGMGHWADHLGMQESVRRLVACQN